MNHRSVKPGADGQRLLVIQSVSRDMAPDRKRCETQRCLQKM